MWWSNNTQHFQRILKLFAQAATVRCGGQIISAFQRTLKLFACVLGLPQFVTMATTLGFKQLLPLLAVPRPSSAAAATAASTAALTKYSGW